MHKTIDNLITIKGGSHADVKRALQKWINLYTKNLADGLRFELYKNGRGSHLIKADEGLNNEYFYYLINYLRYPEGIDYKVDVKGYTRGKDENELKSKNLMVYLSSSDPEYDNVFITAEDDLNYKMDFGGNVTQENESEKYTYPSELKFSEVTLFKIEKKKYEEKKTNRSKSGMQKRFNILSLVIFSAFAFSYAFFSDKEVFFKLHYAIGCGIWIWFITDYKMLRVTKYYLLSLLIATLVFLYGKYLGNHYSIFKNTGLVTIGMVMPIFFLFVQWPLRFLFKAIMKREPVVERPAPSFADFVYIFILFLSTAIIPVIYFN